MRRRRIFRFPPNLEIVGNIVNRDERQFGSRREGEGRLDRVLYSLRKEKEK